MNPRDKIPWARRVKKNEIRRVYQHDAAGVRDVAEIDALGLALYLRCVDILCVKKAREGGGLRCPSCYLDESSPTETYIPYSGRFYRGMDEIALTCPACGFAFTNVEFYMSFRGRQLHSGGAAPAFEHFVHHFPAERDAVKKLLLIDRLITSFHYSLRSKPDWPTRSVGPNLIEGRLKDIIAFLDELSGTEKGRGGDEQQKTDMGGENFAPKNKKAVRTGRARTTRRRTGR